MKLFKCSCVMSDQPQRSKAAIGAISRGAISFFGAHGADLGEEGPERVGAVMDVGGKLAPAGDGAVLRMIGLPASHEHRGHAEGMRGAEIVRQIVEHGGSSRGHRVRPHEALVSRALRLRNEFCGMNVETSSKRPSSPSRAITDSAWRREPLVKMNLRPGNESRAWPSSGAGAITLRSMSCT